MVTDYSLVVILLLIILINTKIFFQNVLTIRKLLLYYMYGTLKVCVVSKVYCMYPTFYNRYISDVTPVKMT